MKKKIVLTLLIVSVLVCLFAISASAEWIDGIDYSFNGNEATVTSKNQSCTVENVVIPEKVVAANGNEYTVTKIADSAFRYNTKVKTIITPPTIYAIGAHAFRTMTALKEIDLNASADFKYFDNAEFYQTTSLVKADLSGCVGLIDMGNGGSYSHTFLGCTSLSTIILPEGLQIIGPQVFNGCTSLVNVTIPSTVTKIGDYAFQGCRALKSMNLPEGLTYLGCNNFQYTLVEKVIFPSTLVTATKDMFNSVNSTLQTVVFANADVSGYTSSVMSNCGPLNMIFYAGSNATTLTNKFTGLKSYSTVSYDQYLLDIAKDDFTGYTSKTIVYGTTNCDACGDVITNLEYFKFTSFTEEMHDAYMCQNCGKVENESKITNTYDPILTFSGYSAKIDGSKICIGYSINYDSLRIYEQKTAKIEGTVKFGITASPVSSIYAKYETVKNDLKPMSNAIVTEVSGSIPAFDFILTDFTEEFYDKPLVMCAYVYDGNDIYYVDAGGCRNYATPITYNIIANA